MLKLLPLLALLFSTAHLNSAEAPGASKKTETIVFLGDSITYAGGYINFVDYFLTVNVGQLGRHELHNRGMPSETVAGTTETTHIPPRPWAHDRFEGDVPPLDPHEVVFCYGMNDGIYAPYSEEIMAKYKAGTLRLVERIQSETGAERITILTPPVFDFAPFEDRVRKDEPFDYRFPHPDYDDVLSRFREWLLAERDWDVEVLDSGGLMRRVLEQTRTERPDFKIADDGIHPGPEGHLLIALPLIEREARGLRALKPLAIEGAGDGTYRAKYRVPLPFLPHVDDTALPNAERLARLNSELSLPATAVPQGAYRLAVDGENAGRVTIANTDGNQGIRVPWHTISHPAKDQSTRVFELVKTRRALMRDLWVLRTDHSRLEGIRRGVKKTAAELEAEIERLAEETRSAVKPIELEITLHPEKGQAVRSR